MILRFLRIREAHLEKVRLWRMLEDVTKYMYTDPRVSQEDQRKWYYRIVEDQSRMDWVIDVDGRDVGVVNLYDIDLVNRRCSWAYYLGEPETRNKGIGKAVELSVLDYVFARLCFHKLCCEVFEWNDSVIKIHQKYGSIIEGTLRNHIHKRGEYHNVVRMAILRQEWEEGIRGKFQYSQAEIEEWEEKIARFFT
jgi:UDP-4-amino-4,6-dideoxy-N-acetyl-beta-L-altrosamine N-acetyltransferase